MVPEERLELSWVAPHDFESCASTSSATPANLRPLYYNRGKATISLLYFMQASNNHNTNQEDPAVDVIRSKLHALYADEPPAEEEIKEVKAHHGQHLSKHQQYMQNLSTSGRSLAEIQTAWHEYYEKLPEHEKHAVWQEFYQEHENEKAKKQAHSPATPQQSVSAQPTAHPHHRKRRHNTPVASKQDVREELIGKVNHRANTHKSNLKALVFGLSMGSFVVFILMFSFFNERLITPFIRPSYAISTPIITDPSNNGPVGPEPKIIIPKINLEAPVVYDEPSIEEKKVQTALERGVLHYATTPNPGELGNSVIFGHSSSNMLNKGKYKFAFLLLKSLDEGDTFTVQKDGKRYVYKVFKKYVTTPKDISVLGANDKKATMTLVTCDPPGMSTNRLIIVGEQIYPNPDANKPSTAITTKGKPAELPSNSPSLWQRIKDWF